MKKLVVSVVMAVLSVAASSFAPCNAQTPAKADTPAFYRFVPGTYVNPWPRFTITYPKDWIERPPRFLAGEVLAATAPGPARSPSLGVVILPFPVPLEGWAEFWAVAFRNMGATEVEVVGNRPTLLPHGIAAREVELKAIFNGSPIDLISLAAKKGDVLIHIGIGVDSGKIGQDIRAMLYSLEFQPGEDAPVEVPPDVQAFLDGWCSDMVSHDLTTLMANYSDRYLSSGIKKGEMERFHRDTIDRVTSCKVTVTDFEAAENRAYLAGFEINHLGRVALIQGSIVKENNEWKWYGNQREVAP